MASQNSSTSRKKINVLAVIVSIILLTAAAAAALYFFGGFNSYNAFIDNAAAKAVRAFTGDDSSVKSAGIPAIEEPALLDKITIEQPSIADYPPVFIGKTDEVLAMEPFAKEFERYELKAAVDDGGFSFTITGIFDRIRDDFDGKQRDHTTWNYSGEYALVSRICFYKDSVVFTDAKPSLIVLDIMTGSVRTKLDIPVFPDSKAAADKNIYYFSGRDQKTYAVEFQAPGGVTDFAASGSTGGVTDSGAGGSAGGVTDSGAEGSAGGVTDSGVSESPGIIHFPVPDAVLSAAADKLSHWIPFEFDAAGAKNKIPVIPVSTEYFPSYADIDRGAVLFVFTVKEQGEYIVGLTDTAGLWVTLRAFTAVITETGALQAVSLDYVADKPSVTLHLAAGTVYYGLTGSMMSGDDKKPASGGVFFTVKKSPTVKG